MHGLNAAEFELTRPSVTVINDAPVQLTPLNDTAETLVRCGSWLTAETVMRNGKTWLSDDRDGEMVRPGWLIWLGQCWRQ